MAEFGIIKYIANDNSHGYLVPFGSYQQQELNDTLKFHPKEGALFQGGDLVLFKRKKYLAKNISPQIEGFIIPGIQNPGQIYFTNPGNGEFLILRNSNHKINGEIKAPQVVRANKINYKGQTGHLVKYEPMERTDSEIQGNLMSCFRTFFTGRNEDFSFLNQVLAHMRISESELLSELNKAQPFLNEYSLHRRKVLRDSLIHTFPNLKTSYLSELAALFEVEDLVGLSVLNHNLQVALQKAFPFQIFDLEAKIFDKEITEFACIRNEETLEYLGKDYPDEEFKNIIRQIMADEGILIGHNIIQFDIPVLEQSLGIDLSKRMVYDTLLWELMLNPYRASYALDTSHSPRQDCEHTAKLFINQLMRLILADYYPDIAHLLPPPIRVFLDNQREKNRKFFNPFKIDIESNSDPYFQKPKEDVFTLKLEEKLNEYCLQSERCVIISSEEYWPQLLKIPGSKFSFRTYSEVHRVIDLEKVKKYIDPESLHYTVLNRIVDECRLSQTPPYWINLPPFIKQYLLSTKKLQLEDICSLPQQSDENQSILCLTPVEFIAEARPQGEVAVYLDDLSLERTSKARLARFSHEELDKLWSDKSLWKLFSNKRNVVKLNEDRGGRIIRRYDPGQKFQYYWIEHIGNREYILWASIGQKKFNLIQREGQFKTISINELMEGYPKGRKFCIDFHLDPKVDPSDRILALNPETPYRDIYWTVLVKKISQIVANRPSILFILDEKELEPASNFLRAGNFFVPEKDLSIRRKIELVASDTADQRVAVFPLSFFDKAAQWLPEDTAFNMMIEGLPLDEYLIWKSEKEKHHEQEILDQESEYSDRNIELESDTYNKLEAFSPRLEVMEYLLWQDSSQHVLILLDPRILDFPTIQRKFNCRLQKVREFQGLEEYEKSLALSNNFFRPSLFQGDIDPEETIPLLEKVFIDGHTFFPEQKAFLRRILPAKENMVISLPTGGGKSVLFEGPALYRGAIFGRLTLIVSPLKALMEDHFNKLLRKGFFTNVDYINQDKGLEVQDIYRRVAGGEILFLYITPERFKSQGFLSALNQRLRVDKQLEYAVFDEAHCISQWGNEFRPDYHLAARNVRELQEASGLDFPVLLFSATITEQVFNHLNQQFLDLQRIEEYSSYNPIRNHIQISFQELEEHDFVDELIGALKRGLDPALSRVIVFVMSRRKTEEYSEQFNDEPGHNFRSAYYHAGLDAEQRQSVYNQYKKGEISVLFATKAFGMGMDIPNIHYIYHFGPSNSFEDFLQEIGRAGRDEEWRIKAGFSSENRITTKCFFTVKHFAKIRDLIQKKQMGWSSVKQVELELRAFFSKCGVTTPDLKKPVPVPLDLLHYSPFFEDEEDTAAVFRLACYWIEQAGKFKQRYYVPGLLEFSNEYAQEEEVDGSEEKELIRLLIEYDRQEGTIQIPTTEIYEIIGRRSLSRVFDLILHLHRDKKLIFRRQISVSPFKTLNTRALSMYANSLDRNLIFPFFAVISLIKELLGAIPYSDRMIFSQEDIQRKGEETFERYFKIGSFEPLWKDENKEKEAQKKEKYIGKRKSDFLKMRVFFCFYIINQIPDVKAEYKIDKDEKEVYTVIYKNSKDEKIYQFLDAYEKDGVRFIENIARRIRDATTKFDLFEFLKELQLQNESLSRLNWLFTTWKRLGFFKLDTSLLPMAIEMFMLDDSAIAEISNEKDKAVFEDFKATIQLKKLRLLVLESLQRIPVEKHDQYIKDYFKCSSAIDIVNLIGQYDRAANLSQFREEALIQAENQLNEDQKRIFDFPPDQNLCVIAGPGSGKTHTLIARVARLIQREHVPPGQILVLAYNRSVVQELRSRLKDLFDDLGYSTITYDLRVNTFHGLIKSVLRERLNEAEGMFPDEDKFKSWERFFLHLYDNEPGYIHNMLGALRYIFVDEFQDITSNRLKILKAISREGVTKLTVIGDPIQSIYGFERANEGGPIDSRTYYEDFFRYFQPSQLPLSINYRSYQNIIDYAAIMLEEQIQAYDMPELVAQKGEFTDSVERYDLTSGENSNNNWLDKVIEFLEDGPGAELAILFRTNAELFRAFAKLKERNLGEVEIYIQSSNDNFFRTREVSHFVDIWRQNPIKELTGSYLQELIHSIQEVASNKPKWDQQGLMKLISLVKEFRANLQDNSILQNLIDYIEDIARRDDGVLWRIYTSHFDVSGSKRIVLSTMHKAKGLEFEQVLITPSFHKLNNNTDFEEYCKEEERLLYVAATRAKDKLYHYQWKREKALFAREPFEFNQQLGCPMEPDMSNLFISSFGKEYIQRFLLEEMELGQEIRFAIGENSRILIIKGKRLGVLRKSLSQRMNDRFGFKDVSSYFVTGTFKYYVPEILDGDGRNGTNFYENLDGFTRGQGFVLLPLFAGFGKVIGG